MSKLQVLIISSPMTRANRTTSSNYRRIQAEEVHRLSRIMEVWHEFGDCEKGAHEHTCVHEHDLVNEYHSERGMWMWENAISSSSVVLPSSSLDVERHPNLAEGRDR